MSRSSRTEMRFSVFVSVFGALLVSLLAGSAGAGPLDIAYRADQALYRIAPPASDAALPKLLEEYVPPPAPQPAAMTEARVPLPGAPLPGTSHGDVWDRVRTGFALPQLDGALVTNWQSWYVTRPQLLKALFDRSRRYIYHVVEELDRRGMPSEIALLPMVESGYNPMALSSAQASGLWQFIPSTGKNYKLDQGVVFDARRDVIASTRAALDYLQSLYERFGDWQLALAAYNWGENGVDRAIARNKAKGLSADYATLSMPQETRNYLPKLQALKNIVANPGANGIRMEPVPNKAYFAAVASDRYIDVDVAARLADVPLEEFVALNPSHKLNLISKGPRGMIVLPVEKVEGFLNNLENYREPPQRGKSAAAPSSPKSATRVGRGTEGDRK